MPIYEYRCLTCHKNFDVFRSVLKHQKNEVCPRCGKSADQTFETAPEYTIYGLPKNRFRAK